MQQDEILVVRLSGGVSIRRCLEADGAQVLVSMGRNRQARVPISRAILATGVSASREEELDQFRQRCETLASEIDLSEVWEVTLDECGPLTLEQLVDLYWPDAPDAVRRTALLLHLERSDLNFTAVEGGYTPRSRQGVDEILARRSREEAQTSDAADLMAAMAEGRMPSDLSQYQQTLVRHVKGFAVHGDSYTRAGVARDLLARASTGAGEPQRQAVALLVAAGVFSPDEPLEVLRAGIPQDFPQSALEAAEAIELDPGPEAGKRRSLDNLEVFSIDDVETRDRDDALSVEVRDGGLTVGIHIADAAKLIEPGSVLDVEAARRMATVYLPEGKIPMLPSRLSEDLGSLVPGERRPVVSLFVRFSGAAEIESWEVVPSVISNRCALSYDEADAQLEDERAPLYEALAGLALLSRGLRRKRQKAGALLFDRPEMSVSVVGGDEVTVKVVQRDGAARRLVGELMVLCNSLLAEFCKKEGIPASYRVQSTPSLEDLDAAALADDGASYDPVLQYRVMRRLAPAEIGTTAGPHGGLGVPAYIQITSPLRRYPDLVMQRQVSHFLATGQPFYTEEEVASVAARAEVQLKEASQLEEQRRRYWFLKHLRERCLGEADPDEDRDILDAVVLENRTGRPALLELADYPFRVRAELPAATAPGESVWLRLHGVDLWHKTAQLVFLPKQEPEQP